MQCPVFVKVLLGIGFSSLGALGAAQDADLIFLGQNIITMDASNVSAVAVRGDRIVVAGSEQDARALQGEDTRVIELGKRALLPGFIDAHGHFAGVARYLDMLDLSSPPVGDVTSVDDIVRKLQRRIENRNIPPGELVYGYGYDDSLLAELRHPDRDDLDRASSDHPIVIRHVSGHLLAANSMALLEAGVGANTSDPAGGIIRRRPGSDEPDGVMEETAMQFFPGTGELLTPQRQSELRREAVQIYAGYGITTIQDSNVSQAYVDRLKAEGLEQEYAADIVTFVMGNPLPDDVLATVAADTSYTGGVRNGGVKFTLDGSPQGRTAWMSEPYNAGPPGAAADYVAYPSYDPDAWLNRIGPLLERRVPVLAHANGDAAIELMIDGVANAIAAGPVPDHRSVIIHAQLIREDQLDRVAELGIIPSFYSVHPFFWGDWHRLSFGEERARFISPVQAAIARDIPFTVHNDSPIVPPDMMRLVEITVNRETRSGFVLGPDQRASVMQALHAITLGAAYQYFEEDEKGSITVGKRADLVILEDNPLTVATSELGEVSVLETFARGKSIFKR
ncbi:MAG TPA: amidohydrolase [Gammaproteobacteria bacterium]|nr:amidohydrolase [Gammaproteobacteria bacterium]